MQILEFLKTDGGTVGVFAIFAVLMVDKVLIFLGKHPVQNGISRMEIQVEEVHRLHTARDEDGVQVLPRLAQQARKQTELLEQIRDGINLANGRD